MACTARIARRGLDPLAAQPEPNLGIIPGAGGTQRLPRIIGIERAAELLRPGRTISGKEALELGLIREEVDGTNRELVARAVELARGAARGTERLPEIEHGPIDVPAKFPAVDIGHRSTAVDAILVRAIREGCRKPLAEGLRLEAKLFGEVCATKDFRIGVENFLSNGPRARASFVHG
jgi:enoyl-CoA hydratase/carnithine racemase